MATVRPVESFLGTWLSLVEHSLGVRGVGSSNLPVPTIHFFGFLSLLLRAGAWDRDKSFYPTRA
jgi:hypothetical protein